MRFSLIVFLLVLFQISWAQTKLDKTLKKFNTESVPYIYPRDLSLTGNTILLDTRKKEEFDVSHLKNAIWVGYKDFNKKTVASKIPDKTVTIVVYCSI